VATSRLLNNTRARTAMEMRKVEPSYAYKEGYYAFSRGWLECKYSLTSTRGKEWQRGFDRAYFDNLQRIKNVSNSRNVH